MENSTSENGKAYISFKKFLEGVPYNLHYEYNYLKGIGEEEKRQSIKKLFIGIATIAVGAIAILIPVLA